MSEVGNILIPDNSEIAMFGYITGDSCITTCAFTCDYVTQPHILKITELEAPYTEDYRAGSSIY